MIHYSFSEKVCQIAHTFDNLRFLAKKVCEIVKTFEQMISKAIKTHGFLKVTCRKCERVVVFEPEDSRLTVLRGAAA